MNAAQTDARTLMVRCLNETRLLHPPTYVAARYLADSVASEPASAWANRSIIRRYSVQSEPRFCKVLRFKRLRETGEREFREFLVASPMTCLAEAFSLDALSKAPSFAKPQYIYSYQWPRFPACPYNFQHYFDGYRERNRDIAKALRASPKSVAVVTDIQKFYPSIRHDYVRRRFAERLDQSGLSAEMYVTVSRLFEHVLMPFKEKGVATGPEFSHVLGDIALTTVDKEIGERLPGNYFRYVDDIVLVVAPEEKKEHMERLDQCLSEGGLELNGEKTDVVSSEEWLGHGPEHKRVVAEYSFEALVFRLKVFLAIHPSKFRDLESVFQSEGFNLPLSRVCVASGSTAFRSALHLFHRRRWKVLVTALRGSTLDLVQYALAVRANMVERVISLLNSGIPRTPTRRRWHAQRLRYLTNRLLYLVPPSEMGFLFEGLAQLPEFAETSALIKMLISGDCGDLLEMPGLAVAAGASLLRTAAVAAPRITLPSTLSAAAMHSAGIFLLYGATELPEETLRNALPDDQEYLLFCAGRSAARRDHADFSYLDEVRTLQLQRKAEERLGMLEHRFSEREALAFEALEIGDEYFT